MSTTQPYKETNYYKIIVWALAAIAVLAIAVSATAYYVKPQQEMKVATKTQHYRQQAVQQPQQQVAVADCDDGNVVGMALGGITGGILGNQVGKGSGKTAATIGGAVGGAYLGKEHLPTRNVACR